MLRVISDGPAAGVVAVATAVLNEPLSQPLVDEFVVSAAPKASKKRGRGSAASAAAAAAAPAADYAATVQSADLWAYLTAAGALLLLSADLSAFSPPPRRVAQSTNAVLMVSPSGFASNAEAAADNHFMAAAGALPPGGALRRAVLAEYASLVSALRGAGVAVHLFSHSLSHGTPDAVFPNNWFSTHGAAERAGAPAAPALVLYPMKCTSRQAEMRPELVAFLASRTGLSADSVPADGRVLRLDRAGLSASPQAYLEGTGSLVLDRPGRTAYLALSERSDVRLAADWASAAGYRLLSFEAADADGRPVYHTNVLMAVASGCAVVCAQALPVAAQRAAVLAALKEAHEVVEISHRQMASFCGNVLELRDGRGLPVLALSAQAADAFTADQRAVLLRHVAALVAARVDTLERVGGGGVRCTLGELFLDGGAAGV